MDRIRNCKYKVLIHHHPLSQLKGYNEYEIEDLIFKRFDFLFSGHIHKNSLNIDLTPNDGVIKFGSSACLSFHHESQIGYSIIDFDFLEDSFSVIFRMYDIKNEVFYEIPPKKFHIPTDEIKREQNRLRKNIRNRYTFLLEESKDLFIENRNIKASKNLLEISTNPVLKNKSLSEIFNDEEQNCPDFQWEKFYDFDKDYIIFGKDKCGKTILLKKIELELLNDYSNIDYLPFYIDIKDWSNSSREFNFEKEFGKSFSINIQVSRSLISEKKIVLLIDNFTFEQSNIIKELEEIVFAHENFRLIICSASHSISSLEHNRFDGRNLSKLYFHRLRKIHIKELTKKNYKLSVEKQEQIVEKISTIFKKLSIPFNYWTISIFLWVFNKDGNNNLNNDVDLIDLYIEKLLEKEQLTLNSAIFTFNNYKKLLAYLAHYLLTKHHKNSYYAKYSEIIDFIELQLQKNPRIRTSPKDIFDYLDSKGILRKRGVDLYSFRLKGVFEYFIAQYMTYDKDFLNKVILDKDYYLSFSNEFEIYAGFKRDDIEFLNKIFSKTKNIFNELNDFYDLENNKIDTILISKIQQADNLGSLIEKYARRLQHSLTEQEKDKMEEEIIKEMKLDESHSEVKQKKKSVINNSTESLEESLKILGKVYRNIDDINDVNLVYQIFDYIVDNACLWSFRLLDEFGEIDISDIIKNDQDGEAKNLIKLISNVIPTLVQVRLYEMIGHINLEGIILDRLHIAKKDSKNNQFKIFLFCFLLCDINYNQHKNLISELIPLIRIPIIKYSFILKLNYYLSFKNNLNKKERQFLKNNLQSQYLKFNKNTDVGELHKGFSKKDGKISKK